MFYRYIESDIWSRTTQIATEGKLPRPPFHRLLFSTSSKGSFMWITPTNWLVHLSDAQQSIYVSAGVSLNIHSFIHSLGVGVAELFTCPYPPKVRARPPRDHSFGASGGGGGIHPFVTFFIYNFFPKNVQL